VIPALPDCNRSDTRAKKAREGPNNQRQWGVDSLFEHFGGPARRQAAVSTEHGTDRLYSAPRSRRAALAFELLQGLVGALLQFVLQLLRLLLLYEHLGIGRWAFISLGKIDQG
jgi:hypothetical protein